MTPGVRGSGRELQACMASHYPGQLGSQSGGALITVRTAAMGSRAIRRVVGAFAAE